VFAASPFESFFFTLLCVPKRFQGKSFIILSPFVGGSPAPSRGGLPDRLGIEAPLVQGLVTT